MVVCLRKHFYFNNALTEIFVWFYFSRAKSTDFHLASDTEQYGDSDYEDVGQPGSKYCQISVILMSACLIFFLFICFIFRKIKPVDGLVLKTPIAFQKDSDLDMIPIRKEGMAVCEKCGAIGVKHSFYTKERRFCSQACAKSVNEVPSVANSNHTGTLLRQHHQKSYNNLNFNCRKTI